MFIAPENAMIKRVRLHNRLKLSVDIEVVHGVHTGRARTLDMSPTGISFIWNAMWHIDLQQILSIRIPSSVGVLSLDGEVVRTIPDGKHLIVGCSIIHKEVMKHVLGILKKDHRDQWAIKHIGA